MFSFLSPKFKKSAEDIVLKSSLERSSEAFLASSFGLLNWLSCKAYTVFSLKTANPILPTPSPVGNPLLSAILVQEFPASVLL